MGNSRDTNLPKLVVAGSNPVARSNNLQQDIVLQGRPDFRVALFYSDVAGSWHFCRYYLARKIKQLPSIIAKAGVVTETA